MLLLDVLGRRWTLRILWELRGRPLSFRGLRATCDDVSPSVLNARLAELRKLGLVEVAKGGYTLTAQARSLGKLLLPVDSWARRWAAAQRCPPEPESRRLP
jgi:DNA-binding HxlR family transcriptional regulator